MACKECKQAITAAEARRLGVSNADFHVRKYHAASCSRYKGATHPSGETPSNTRKQLAGDARAKSAIEHLTAAKEALNAACRDLCSVNGAREHYRIIAKLSTQIDTELHDINLDYVRDKHPFTLSREPTDREIDELHTGCWPYAEPSS